MQIIYNEDFFKPKKFDIDKYLEEINFNNLNSIEFLRKIKYLNIEERKKLLTLENVKEKLHNFFNDCGNNQYEDYRLLFDIIDVNYFFNLFSFEEVNNYFKKNKNLYVYKLYAVLCEIDVNSVIKEILDDDNLFKDFYNNLDYFFSVFCNMDYDLILKYIKKCQELNLKPKRSLLSCSLNKEDQLRILNEDISDEFKYSIINSMNKDNRNTFLSSDIALKIYKKLSVDTILYSELNEKIIKDKDFLSFIQSNSLLTFRQRINTIASNNDDTVIEEVFSKWENDLINSVNTDTGIFKYYEDIILKYYNNPDDLYRNTNYNYYLTDPKTMELIYNLRIQDKDKNIVIDKKKIMEELKKITNYKLSELIIDNLFRDNIYNVWINIKEIIRYNINADNSTISFEKFKFYRSILNIDKMSIKDKINFYNLYKDKNIYEIFYDDIRKAKDASYKDIQKKVINLRYHDDYINKNLSEEYGTQVYDLRDKNYYMLVRCMKMFSNTTNSERDCYSVISNNNTLTYGSDLEGNMYLRECFLYGFSSVDPEHILHISEGDSYSINSNDADEASKYINRILTPEQLINSNFWYNEVQILNEKKGKYKYEALKPDFIICKDKIRDIDIEESKRLQIPIALIKNKNLENKDIRNIIEDGEKSYAKNVSDEVEKMCFRKK